MEILGTRDIHKIDSAAMEILETVGIEIYDERALELFNEAGATVNHNEKKVKVPEYIVKEAIRKAPSQFAMFGRNGTQQVIYGDDKLCFICGSNSPNVVDLETDQLRPATLKDVEDGARLADALENVSIVYAMATPQDVPKELELLYSFEGTLKNTEKPIEDEVGTRKVLGYCFKLASAVVGGEEELKKRPLFTPTIEMSSPLKIHKPQIEMLYESSIRGMPMQIVSATIIGATGPVTLAGALAQSTAEVLSGITLSQLINPGTPVIFMPYPVSLDMTTAQLAHGSPETCLMGVSSRQLGHYYGLPTQAIGFGQTNSEIPGIQAGYEKMLFGVTAALAGGGAIAIGRLGSRDSTSFVQAVIDNEIAGIIIRFMERFEVNSETLALHVIRKAIVRGYNFLTLKHTREHFRKEHTIPKLSNRLLRERWDEAGAKDVSDKARVEAKEILETHYAERLDKDIEKELRKIMEQARKDLVR